MDIDRDALVQVFLSEATEHLLAMEESLLALEARAGDAELVAGVFRGAHTLKGNALSLGYSALAGVAHALEDVLELLRERKLEVTPDLVTLLLQGVDALRALAQDAAAGVDEMKPEHRRLVERVRARAAAEGTDSPEGPHPQAHEERNALASFAPTRPTLRVDVDRLDRLMDLAGEIAIARGRVAQMLETAGSSQILEVHREADRSFLDMQELILHARMVPVGPSFRPYARTVRDVASTLGKQAHLVIEGEDVEVDTLVIAQLRDPLTHMFRNALDHGIEPPALRRARGKDPAGTIVLRAFRDAGNIVIEVSDDGAGLDRARIAERARSRGLAVDAARSIEAEMQRLIFEPGFSTAERVTDVSGRGVGMDVVRRNVEALRGSVGVRSREGEGTTFTIRLPLTLAIIDGFGVAVGGETYVVPLDAVTECLDLPPAESLGDDGRGVVSLRGGALPCLRLRQHFALEGRHGRESVVVVRHDGGRAGLVVDALLGEQQTVIKPLGALFRGVSGIAGSAILGSGHVALILDIPALLREALEDERNGRTARGCGSDAASLQ